MRNGYSHNTSTQNSIRKEKLSNFIIMFIDLKFKYGSRTCINYNFEVYYMMCKGNAFEF